MKKFIEFVLSFSILAFGNSFCYLRCIQAEAPQIEEVDLCVSSTDLKKDEHIEEVDACVPSANMKKDEHACVLSSTKNTRDLGGYLTSSGKITKKNRIFRSDNAPLSSEDIEKLTKLHLVLDIDLRTPREIEMSEDAFAKIPGVKYSNIPMHFVKEHETIDKLKSGDMKLDQAFIEVISDGTQKEKIKEVFESIAKAGNGLVIIHCSHGKDRTGIISALILGLCGVQKNDIINNFSVTQELLNPGVTDFSSLPNLFSTDQSIMNNLIDYIEQKLGGYEQFLISCGIEKNILNTVRSRLLDDITKDVNNDNPIAAQLPVQSAEVTC